ncbi:MAG: tRNA uridine(34) 5-carboxymethylaminomethyl modification radical SAM/GNAT enzyme Elp3 [Candidatus Nanoarchaeia archaeon]
MKKFYQELISKIIEDNLSLEQTLKLRRKLARKYHPKVFPSITQILMHASESQIPKLKHLISKPSRVVSGVAVVAVMTKPIKCPHGKCVPCPGGPDSFFGSVPQSYTGKEPATMRAVRNFYDPYLQIFNRLEQYILLDHMPDKVELIVMGGTFPSFPKKYQEEFITYCFKALNDFSTHFFKEQNLDFEKFKDFFELPTENIDDKERIGKIQKKILALKKKSSLMKEQKRNESSLIRCVGLTIESRPDYAMLKHANEMLKLGCTRVELGIQSTYDDVLKKIERGHSVADSIKSMLILKDLGFKVNAHMMLGLPGSSPEKDLSSLKELFTNPDFRPDMLKLYPCMVLEGTKLHSMYKEGRYKPLTTKDAVEIIAKFKSEVPPYVRIMRVQRDIPTKVTVAGVDKTNLRQYVSRYMKEHGTRCRCIRCREVGRAKRVERVEVMVRPYDASKGREFFISVEDPKNDVLVGFCRLRFPFKSLRKEITKKSALVRELHVYSPLVQIGKEPGKGQMQHKGFGAMLLGKAESIAKEHGYNKIVIISGVGVRSYYKSLGYKLEGPYMVKKLD